MSNRNVIEYGGGSSRTGTSNGWQHLDFNNSQYSLNDPVLQGDQLNSVQLQLRYGPGNVYLRLYETDNPKHGSGVSANPWYALSGETSIANSDTIYVPNPQNRTWYTFTFTNILIDLTKYYYIWVQSSGSPSLYFKYGGITAPEIHGGSGNNKGTLNHKVNVSTLITNTAPSATISINDSNLLNSNILTTIVTTTDVDGDNVTVSYQWKKNGVNINGETNSTLDITNTITGDDIAVTVTVTPNDGTEDGAIVESTSIIIDQLDDLSVSPTSQSFVNELNNIIITSPDNGATIYYTLDGTDPTNQSTEYTAPITINNNGTTQLKAIAYKIGFSPSNILGDNQLLEYTKLDKYSVSSDTASGDIESRDSIVLLSNGFDETIYYTLDNTDPTDQSSVFNNSLKISTIGNVTLKIIAIGSASDSDIEIYNYNVIDWLDNQEFNIDNDRKQKFKDWRQQNINTRKTTSLDWTDVDISANKTEWGKMKKILRDSVSSNEISNGDKIKFIPKNKTAEIEAAIFYDANAITPPNNENELVNHIIESGTNFYIPFEDEDGVDNYYWAKLSVGNNSINIKFLYNSQNDEYLYELYDSNLNQTESNVIDENSSINIGSRNFKLFTGGIGGEDNLDIDNIDDILTIFNCAIQKIQVECSRLDALNKILCLKECMLKVNEKK